MSGSNFSIINGADGQAKVPISTPANDSLGNTVVGHLIMTSVSGVALPVDSLHPLSVALTAVPLPAGAATDASLAAIVTQLTKMNTSLTALTGSEAPYSGVVALTVDQAQTAQRGLRIACTTAGNVSLTYADGSTDTIPVAVGLSYIAGAFTKVSSAGTTAVATYANLR